MNMDLRTVVPHVCLVRRPPSDNCVHENTSSHYLLVPDKRMLKQIVQLEDITSTSQHETPCYLREQTQINSWKADLTLYSIYKYDLPSCITHAHFTCVNL